MLKGLLDKGFGYENNVFFNTENWKEDDIWTFFDITGLRKGGDFVGVDFLRGKFC